LVLVMILKRYLSSKNNNTTRDLGQLIARLSSRI
jgi:hypothetical protein